MNIIKASFEPYRNEVINNTFNVRTFEDFIFHDFTLTIDDMVRKIGLVMEYLIHFEPKDKIFVIENREHIGSECKVMKVQWIYSQDITRGVAVVIPEYRNKVCHELQDKIAFDICRVVLWYMGWIMNESQKRIQKIKKSIGHKYKYSREHRLSTQNNKIWLLDDIVNYVHDSYSPEGGHHNIECPCWEVRGHYRHYKSGKVVFIPAYRKGKQRDKVPPKDHVYVV